MSVASYSIGFARYRNFRVRFDRPEEVVPILKAWRNHHGTSAACTACRRPLPFRRDRRNFAVCCERFFYRPGPCYVPESLAVRTPGYEFLLPCMKRFLAKRTTGSLSGGRRRRRRRRPGQEYLVLPDPVYWQVLSTLVFERTLRFASGVPMTKKTDRVLPASRAPSFYRQVQEAPLNHGSLARRSGGKNTFFRQIALGKRCELSARAMIVPDADLAPNEISIPRRLSELLGLEGAWVLLNRMPTLQPDNFVALRVARLWEHECFGIPLEILRQINGDFDGDECNLYVVRGPAAQAECETLLNSERNAGSATLGLKLHPCQDALVAYRHLRDARSSKLRDVFPEGFCRFDDDEEEEQEEEDGGGDGKEVQSLESLLRTVYDLRGSREVFECFVRLSDLYRREMQDEWTFGLALAEFEELARVAEGGDFENFRDWASRLPPEKTGCLLFQILALAKGSLYHGFQMFGSIGDGGENSFWRGLTVRESEHHALAAFLGFKLANDIWIPGYVFYKNCFYLQGLIANHEGNLVDGDRIVERDALRSCRRTALMSDLSFRKLLREHFPVRRDAAIERGCG